MNYGYNKTSKNWKEDRKVILATELAKTLKMNIMNKFGSFDNDGFSPYIEVDGSYGGVRIRRITNLSEKDAKKLVEDADKIYDFIMDK